MNASRQLILFPTTVYSGVGYQRLALALRALDQDQATEEATDLDEQVKLASKSLRYLFSLVSIARNRRIEAGFSQEQLEARSGLTVNKIREIERLSLGASLASYMVYLMALGVTLADTSTQT